MTCGAPRSFFNPVGFRIVSDLTPTMEHLVQKATIPGINVGNAAVKTGFVEVVNPGNMTYNELVVTFKIDEELKAYDEVLDWMEKIAHPDNLSPQYEHLRCDIRLLALGSDNELITEFQFTDCYPTSLDMIHFDSTLTDVQYLTTTATFKFNRMFRKKP